MLTAFWHAGACCLVETHCRSHKPMVRKHAADGCLHHHSREVATNYLTESLLEQREYRRGFIVRREFHDSRTQVARIGNAHRSSCLLQDGANRRINHLPPSDQGHALLCHDLALATEQTTRLEVPSIRDASSETIATACSCAKS